MTSDNTNMNHRNMLVMKASAGSGKTYNLALQYIKHLLFAQGEDGKLAPRRHGAAQRVLNAHRLLLAITFTNKATDEMKSRIVKELYNLSRPDVKSDYLRGFVAETGLTERQIRSLARDALSELLFDYSNFNVSTIDSFFQSILRNFARELDRDFNYDIQLEEDYAVRVAVHNFLLSLGQKGKPTQVDNWVKEYQNHMLHGDPEKRRWKFFDDGGDLTKFAKQINTELFRGKMGKIRDYLGHVDDNGDFVSDFSTIREFVKFVHGAIDSCRRQADGLLDELRGALQPHGDALSGSKQFKKWLNKGPGEDLSSSLANADRNKIEGQFLKKHIPDDKVIDRLYSMVTAYFKCRLWRDFLTHIHHEMGLLGMLAMIDIFLENYRHETNSILIGDTNEMIAAVLEGGSDFVFERTGTTISHFLIDEFQDTSTKQYENFRGLLRESLASGHFNMLIGDAKQSIYRFRNADPTVFRDKVEADFKNEIYHPAVEPGQPTSTNYRSSRNIIQFNNRLFEGVMSEYRDFPAVAATYADVTQGMPASIDSGKVPGYVKLLLGGYDQLLSELAPEKEVAGEVEVLDILPEYLLKLHERYDWGQIGILVNTNSHGNQVVECVLEHNKRVPADRRISIISGESLLLNNSPIIRRVIAMLRLIDVTRFSTGEDDSDVDEAAALPLNRKRDSDRRLYVVLNAFIKAMSARPNASPVEAGAMLTHCFDAFKPDDDNADSFMDMMGKILPPAHELTTLVSIVETIISAFKAGGDDAVDVDAETAFLLAFQDTVVKFSTQRNGGTVREFLKYWDEKKGVLAVSSADGGDAVNIMTIHKAKGLEFDCVVIPFATWNLTNNPKETSYWMPRGAFVDALRSLPCGDSGCDVSIVPPLLSVNKASTINLNQAGCLDGQARAFVQKQMADVLIDNLNKTYVAFTRPRSELHILSNAPAVAGKSGGRRSSPSALDAAEPAKNLVELMSRLAPVMMNPAHDPQAESVSCYELGQEPSREEIVAKMRPKPDHSRDAVMTAYPVMPIPSDLRVRVENASGSRVNAGIRLHSLLSRIHDRDDVERVIAHGLKHGLISANPDDPCGIDNVNAHVRGPILGRQGRVAAWFDPANKVYSERTITSPSSSLWDEDGIENLRPDRIIRRPDGTIIVIDYKSGERRDRQYCRQVRHYMSKLSLIFPGSTIKGRIWYVTRGIVIDADGHAI